MSKFSFFELMNDQSKEEAEKESAAFRIEHISIEKLIPSKMNKYSVEDVRELKSSIEFSGLQQNLLVRPKGDDYEVLSGHRRLKAMTELYNEGNERFKTIPCKVTRTVDDIQAELQLLLANSTARELTDYEKTYQAQRLYELLKDLQSSGQKVKGRKRDIVADLMGVSASQVARMESINKKLVPEFKEEFKEGNVNITTAYEISKLPEEQQQEVLEECKEGVAPTPATVKEKAKTTTKEKERENYVTHELKIYPKYFKAVKRGLKTFEFRRNDRGFKVGDVLKLEEYDPQEEAYTGKSVEVKVSFVLEGGQVDLPQGFVIMSIKKFEGTTHAQTEIEFVDDVTQSNIFDYDELRADDSVFQQLQALGGGDSLQVDDITVERTGESYTVEREGEAAEVFYDMNCCYESINKKLSRRFTGERKE